MSCITIDKNKCKSCHLCLKACPLGLIKISNETGKNGEKVVEFFDENSACLGCAVCATVCPDLAIVKVEKE